MPKDNDTITISKADLALLVAQQVQEAMNQRPSQPATIEGNLKLAELAQTMKDASEAQRQAEYEQRLKAAEAEMALGIEGRSQLVCDKLYPKQAGDRLWKVKLEDRNNQPQLVVAAPTGEDARARYEKVCGIIAVTDRRSKWNVVEA